MPKGTEGPDCRSLSPTEASYIAGLIDGEGCLSVHLTGKILRATLSVGMTHAPTIKWFHSVVVCGSVHTFKRGNYKPSWRWHCGGHKACQLLVQVMPYMITKKRQAELFVELMEIRRAMSKGSRRRGWPSGARGAISKYEVDPESHARIISEMSSEKALQFDGKEV